MTVTTTTASQTFQGNGTATAFPCAFEIFLNTDVNVFFVNPTTGTQTQAVLNTDYTISGAGAQNGFTVNTTVPVPTGTNLYVVRALPLTQPTDFTNQGDFFPTMHEAAFDRATMLIQQIANYSEGLNITMPPGLVPQPSTLFPIPAAGSLIGWNAAGTALVNTGPTTGVGGISDINVAANAAIAATKINFTQPASNQFFTQNGAVINRFNDRVFIGGATAADGAFPQVSDDWFSAFERSIGYASAAAPSMLFALTNNSNASASALTAAAQSLNLGAAGTSCIGTEAYVVNNNATLATNAWGFYGEAHRTTSAVGSIYGMELDTRTLVASINPSPYTQGDAIGIQLGSGAGVSASGQHDASAAIQIVGNPMKWQAGIVFNADSITGADGTGGANTGVAVALAAGHTIQWYGSASVVTGNITSGTTSAANATGINFSGAGFQVRQLTDDAPLLYVFPAANAVNYVAIAAAATGGAPVISAGGSDTNIDLMLAPQGTGNVKFGTYTATAPSATGYITIKDSAGNVRKLLCA